MLPTRELGFTLVELAIVLVIIGLLVGGVLAGQDLIVSARINSIITDTDNLKAASLTFRDKYGGIPGDFSKATLIWGSLGGTGSDAACQSTTPSGTLTCNGDGNGQLNGGGAVREDLRFWQHLSNAGLIPGQYTGSISGGVGLGINVPPLSKIPNACWLASFAGVNAGTASAFAGSYGNRLSLQIYDTSTNTTGAMGLLSPSDAQRLDTKADDGVPGTGMLVATKVNLGAGTLCTSTDGATPPSDAGATYMASNTNPDCRIMYFKQAFY